MEKLRLYLARPLPGSCPECGAFHAPEQPHKLESLFYRYGFYDDHGRHPTAEDAAAHCPEDIRQRYLHPEQPEQAEPEPFLAGPRHRRRAKNDGRT